MCVPSVWRWTELSIWCVSIHIFPVERVCVEYPSYILSADPLLILSYRRKNVIRIEGIVYTSNEGLSWQGLGEDVRHVEDCRHMTYVDVSFLQVVLKPFDFQVDMPGSWEFPGLMLFVHIAIVDRLSSNMLTHVEMGVYYSWFWIQLLFETRGGMNDGTHAC